MDDHYRHTQVGWVIIGSTAALLLVLPMLAMADLPWGLAVVGGFTALVILLFGWLTVRVDTERILVLFGVGLIRKRIPFAQVRSYRPVQNRWIYGWGIRFFPGGILWNVSGLSAVELSLEGDKRFRIGTDEPEALAAAIARVIGKPAPLTPEEAQGEQRRARRGVLILAAVLGAVMIALAVLFALHLRPPTVAVTPEAFSVRSVFYSERLPYGEITSLTLEENLPRISARTNGFALAGTLRGHFRLDELGGGQLFIEAGKPPYILARTARSYVIVNFPEPERTRALYEELRGRWPGR